MTSEFTIHHIHTHVHNQLSMQACYLLTDLSDLRPERNNRGIVLITSNPYVAWLTKGRVIMRSMHTMLTKAVVLISNDGRAISGLL